MAFRFRHTLESRAAVSVVASLWNHEDIDSLKHVGGRNTDEACYAYRLDELTEKGDSEKRDRRLALHKRVTSSVSKLVIPENVKEFLLTFVQVMGESLEGWITEHYPKLEIRAWQFRFERFTEGPPDLVSVISRSGWENYDSVIDVDLRKVLKWTPDGEIDLEQTGEALVKNENEVIKRFRLAYDYCLEDEMLRLWPSVQDHFSHINAWVSHMVYGTNALFWWRYFRHFWPKPVSTYLSHLEATESVQRTSLYTAELLFSCFSCRYHYCSPLGLYLAKKMCMVQSGNITVDEKRIASKRYGAIFFRMPERIQVKMLKEFPKSVLKLLLFWPHQSFFKEFVERNWSIFDADLFDSILFHIGLGVERYNDSDVYKSIFLWFWSESPARLKNVERIFYDRNLHVRGWGTYTPLRYFVGIHFRRSPESERRLRRLLFDGVHVLELATRTHLRDVLSGFVHACLPAEEWDEKMEVLETFFKATGL